MCYTHSQVVTSGGPGICKGSVLRHLLIPSFADTPICINLCSINLSKRDSSYALGQFLEPCAASPGLRKPSVGGRGRGRMGDWSIALSANVNSTDKQVSNVYVIAYTSYTYLIHTHVKMWYNPKCCMATIN